MLLHCSNILNLMHNQRGTSLSAAALAVAAGDVIAYPTEGVFGLGCNPNNEQAVAKLIDLKGRASEKGLIIIAASRQQLAPFTATVSDAIEQQLDASWPGPVTWILPAAETVPALVTGGRSTIAARVTAHRAAAKLCEACGHALISTSANLSGQPPCVDADQVAATFNNLGYLVDLPIGDLSGPTPIFDGVSGKQLR